MARDCGGWQRHSLSRVGLGDTQASRARFWVHLQSFMYCTMFALAFGQTRQPIVIVSPETRV